MSPLHLALLLLYVAVFAAPPIVSRFKSHRRLKQKGRDDAVLLIRLFRAASQQLHLGSVGHDPDQGACISGQIDGCEVYVACASRPPDAWVTTVSVALDRAHMCDLRLCTAWSRATLAGASVVETGDSSFDRLVKVSGPTPFVLALLTNTLRSALLFLASRGTLTYRDGLLTFRVFKRPRSWELLVPLVQKTLDVARAFPSVTDVSEALAEAARTDPVPGVRERCLITLVAEAPEHPRTAGALDAALCDPSDAVRIIAAAALGERGVSVLREIATCDGHEEETAARAIRLLGGRLSAAETLTILDTALAGARHSVAAAAMTSLARSGDAAACQRLQELLDGDDSAMAVAAANALGEAPTAAAVEPALIETLARASLEVQHAIVRALAQVGDVGTLGHLHALIERGKCDSSLVPVVQQAIAAIQTRLPGASPGQISLAEDASGELALANDDATGRLSLPPSSR